MIRYIKDGIFTTENNPIQQINQTTFRKLRTGRRSISADENKPRQRLKTKTP